MVMNSPELNCTWHFAEKQGGSDVGPNEPMQQNFKKCKWASLVRESIQNSLDAVSDKNEPVEVHFSFGTLRSNSYPNFFNLKNNIKGCLDYYQGNKNAESLYMPMKDYLTNVCGNSSNLAYIKVSDYNTIGMDYTKDRTDSPFYAFVRAAGVSNKSDATAGGSFGFGKAAYFYLSTVRAIIVSTKTIDGKYFFEGVASLCTHKTDGVKREAVGYYDNNNGEPTDRLENIPIRFQREEAGTDFYIMGLRMEDETKEEISNEMQEAVLRNFWMAIYDNRLKVTIDKMEITSDNIIDIMRHTFQEDNDESIRKIKDKYNPRPYLDAVANVNIDKNHRLIKEHTPLLGSVLFYAYINKNGKDTILYMRSPRMLVYGHGNNSNYGFYGVFICDDKKGNEILHKMENPAHTEWKAQDENNKKEFQLVKKEIDDFIRRCVEKLFPPNPSSTVNISGLDDYLYIPTEMDDDEDLLQKFATNKSNNNTEYDKLIETSRINTKEIVKPVSKLSVGQVMITTSSTASKSTKGNLLSGHSLHKSKNKGGGAGTGILSQRNSFDADGMKGTYAEPIPVKYRSFAQNVNGEIQHFLVIHSERDIENARIDITIGGAQDDDVQEILWSNIGTIKNNSLHDLNISKGKNIIKIQFADNLKHAIKLEPYEVK